MAKEPTRSGRAPVNGLEMYFEVHGEGGVPLVLLHGALSATETSFGMLLDGLAEGRQVVALEQQAHGRTADVDRPLTYEQMTEDTAAALQHLGIERADLFGYSMGSGIAMTLAMRRPETVRKLVLATPSFSREGLHPGLLEGIEDMDPEVLTGTPFHQEYLRLAPRPEDWPRLIQKVQGLDRAYQGWSAEDVTAISAPVLILAGDSDIIRPEHAVEMFRLLGGGVAGDVVGLPRSRLAILPGTTHITLVHQADLLLRMVPAFLDAPMNEEGAGGPPAPSGA